MSNCWLRFEVGVAERGAKKYPGKKGPSKNDVREMMNVMVSYHSED